MKTATSTRWRRSGVKFNRVVSKENVSIFDTPDITHCGGDDCGRPRSVLPQNSSLKDHFHREICASKAILKLSL
jgi:hypothetical protein